MNVKDLVREIEYFDENAEVYLSSDAEGNSFAKLDGCNGADGVKAVILYPMHQSIDYDDIVEE